MAHRSLSHRFLALGALSALLVAVMAGSAVALDAGDGATDSVDDDPVGDVVDEVVESTAGTADDATDGVRDVVEKAASGDAEGAADATAETVGTAADNTRDTVSGAVDTATGGSGGEPAGGGEQPTEVSPDPAGGQDATPHRAGSSPRLDPDGGRADRSASTSTGFSTRAAGSASRPSAYEPPATSGALDRQPEVADEASADDPDVAALLDGPRPSGASVPSPREVPQALLLTATALLVMVGTGHLLHAVRQTDLL